MNTYMANLYLKKANVVHKLCGLLILSGTCKQGGLLITGDIDKKKTITHRCACLWLFLKGQDGRGNFQAI